ncbi:MAG: hypothetical protein D6E12_18305 [Desulfovibrio sp.]|nr:MAG: hypothetical protein D6E12_18305 [Desulfovibrio sp.]
MHVEQNVWTAQGGWSGNGSPAKLVLAFGAGRLLRDKEIMDQARAMYPDALFAGCSTSGEIVGDRVLDDSVILTAVDFEHAQVKGARTTVAGPGESFRAGQELAGELVGEDLAHVLVLSDGLLVNGSELVKGLMNVLGEGGIGRVSVTGGLAGDSDRFAETVTLLDSDAESGLVVAVGLYSTKLKVGYGSLGGWDPFGPERVVTRSSGNVLYEVDGKSALELYKTYLGKHAEGLPSTGLLFPLSLRPGERYEEPVVRTILSVDEENQSMTFAGDVPQGSVVRFMKANLDRLVNGAMDAASAGLKALDGREPELALLISCVGRKLVLGQRVEEEVEGVREVLGTGAAQAGFYSYGEISPFTASGKCRLHNQTMTITLFSEE